MQQIDWSADRFKVSTFELPPRMEMLIAGIKRGGKSTNERFPRCASMLPDLKFFPVLKRVLLV